MGLNLAKTLIFYFLAFYFYSNGLCAQKSYDERNFFVYAYLYLSYHNISPIYE